MCEKALAVIGLLSLLPLAALLLWRDDARVRQIAAGGLFLPLGSLRYTLPLPDLANPGHVVAYRDRGWVTLQGQVAAETDVRDSYTDLRLAVDQMRIDGQEHLVKGAVLVRAPRYRAYSYGDELEVEGELETAPVLGNFSYRDYLARQGIYGMAGRP